jgi:hypothetical protein
LGGKADQGRQGKGNSSVHLEIVMAACDSCIPWPGRVCLGRSLSHDELFVEIGKG